MRLDEKEQALNQTVSAYRNKVEELLTEINRRNDHRVAEEKRLYTTSNAVKRMVSYGIFAAITFAAFLAYKGLGIF